MNILVLNGNIAGVGTYRRSFYFSRELARAGHQVTLITVSRNSPFRAKTYYKKDWLTKSYAPQGREAWVRIIEGPGLGYHWLPGWGSGPLDVGIRLKEILSDRYEVIYGFEYRPNVAWPVYLTRGIKKYHFLSDWCDWFAGGMNEFRDIKIAHTIDGFFEERIRLVAERLSVTSKLLQRRAISIGIQPEKITHIPEGAAVDYIQPFPVEQARRKLNLPCGVPIIATVSKGDMRQEIYIFHKVLQEVPKAIYLMIGRPSATAIKLAHNLGIDDQIYPAGWVSDLNYPLFLACADVCFCRLEDNFRDRARWPAKILDFLTAGRATVTNGVGEVEPLFRQHAVGILAGFGAEEFASSILALLKDAPLRCLLGTNARRLMEEEWDYRLRRTALSHFIEG